MSSSIVGRIVAQKSLFAPPMLWLVLLLAGTVLTSCQPKPAGQETKQQPAQASAEPVVKYGVEVVSGPMDSILQPVTKGFPKVYGYLRWHVCYLHCSLLGLSKSGSKGH